jgi:hypothetical protein
MLYVMSCVMCHVSCVLCHMSYVVCHVICHIGVESGGGRVEVYEV